MMPDGLSLGIFPPPRLVSCNALFDGSVNFSGPVLQLQPGHATEVLRVVGDNRQPNR